MRLQPLVEIHHAHNRHPNRDDEQTQRQHGKRRETAPRREIAAFSGWGVHPHELEDKVRHGGEVDDDDEGLAVVGFLPRDVGGEEEQDDGDGDGGDGEVEFGVARGDDHDDELHGEAEEEEEVEFEEGDVDL
jgi:hypothetical protein